MESGLRPANLDDPLSTDERAEAMARLLLADQELTVLATFAGRPVSEWPDDLRARFHGTGLPYDDPASALSRWWTIFADETRLVHDVRNRLVHQTRVPDGDVRRALWIAERLIRIAFGET